MNKTALLSLATATAAALATTACGADYQTDFVDAHGTTWRHLGPARATQHRDAIANLDPISGRPIGPFVDTVDRPRDTVSAAILDIGDRQEFRAEAPSARAIAEANARYDAGLTELVPGAVDATPTARIAQALVRGSDDRVTRSQSSNPYKMITQYWIPISSTEALTCTATLVGTKWASTAGHCVYDRGDNAWIYGVSSASTLASHGLSTDRGYVCINGTCSWVTARFKSAEWASTTFMEAEHDYALLELQDNLGSTQGYMQLSSITDEDTLQDLTHYNAGYPGEVDNNDVTGQWGMQCDVLSSTGDGRLTYNCDTSDGNSGGPVYYRNANGLYYETAIHSGSNATHNTGARVGGVVRDWFVSKM